MSPLKHFLVFALLLAVLCPANARLYGLCDAVKIDAATKTLDCNITEPRHTFVQQNVDEFWAALQADQNYLNGRIRNVLWRIVGTVVQVTDDVAFVEPRGMSLPWDIILEGDVNTVYDVNWGQGTHKIAQTEATHTAIKVTKLGFLAPLISFSPVNGRRTVRNMVLVNKTGFSTYIAGSVLNPMQISIEGDLNLSDSFIENIAALKAQNIAALDSTSIKNVAMLKAKNVELDANSSIDMIGSLGETAIELQGSSTGLQLSSGSRIRDLLGKLYVDGNIVLTDSAIETWQQDNENVIQSIEAENLTLQAKSRISGIGGNPGLIVLQGSLWLDQNSSITGRLGNEVQKIEAGSIKLESSSWIKNIGKEVAATGREQFEMRGNAKILSLHGNVTSCAPIVLDGNETRIEFALESEKRINAPSLDLNSGAAVTCSGEEACDYIFFAQQCDSKPEAELDVNGSFEGVAPLLVQFIGSCYDAEQLSSCEINYGNGSDAVAFTSTSAHTYYYLGTYEATLTATDSKNQVARAKKRIIVLAEPREEPAADQNGEAVGVQIVVSSPVVKPGSTVFVEIDLNEELASFSLENDFGAGKITEIPESFPARLGPFPIGENLEPTVYSFTVKGETASGRAFSRKALFSVEPVAADVFAFLSVFSGMPFFPWSLALAAVIVVAVLMFLALRRRAEKEKLPAEEKAAAEAREKKPWEKAAAEEKGGKPKEAPPTGGKAAAEEKPRAAPAEPSELPPWLREEEEAE